MMRTTIAICIVLLIAVGLIAAYQKEDASCVPYMIQGTLTVKEERGIYKITSSSQGKKDETVHFSNERKILKADGIEPIEIEDMQTLVGKKLSDVIAEYGEPHADIGSGFYIPAYITKDAYLISLSIDSAGVVAEVLCEDLINGGQGTRGRFYCLPVLSPVLLKSSESSWCNTNILYWRC